MLEKMILFKTPRLLIRRLIPEDVDSLFAIFSDPIVTRWMGDGNPLTPELCQKWIAVSLHNYETKGFGASAVMAKDTNELIGCSGIVYDPERKEPEIIYAFHPQSWGKGYASELVPAMLEYGLTHCKLKYILATIDSENKISQHVVAKAGMKFQKEELEPDGHITRIYQITADSYPIPCLGSGPNGHCGG